ncbi:MAG: hypothetical protein F4X23_08010 [Gemmatimonadales bacterium]|nr:hypothetical protein [Gemmatimonadales bacterium]
MSWAAVVESLAGGSVAVTSTAAESAAVVSAVAGSGAGGGTQDESRWTATAPPNAYAVSIWLRYIAKRIESPQSSWLPESARLTPSP